MGKLSNHKRLRKQRKDLTTRLNFQRLMRLRERESEREREIKREMENGGREKELEVTRIT